jgi:hypothetical protein
MYNNNHSTMSQNIPQLYFCYWCLTSEYYNTNSTALAAAAAETQLPMDIHFHTLIETNSIFGIFC